ncbi:hypothetical protein [Actinomycetospora termitidis]|uniref:Uncharacterized protein n=1 Tax=Actinomycetospora termitidis TaxID=3053470 RepID=A0ABT7MED5_9PSEU|nr:hypothetical protein [Actinomycetospora sp. Odt1-22]MDL5159030.1 hypothetical protein [Actinomycetospora sp. Odt1-22]
MSTTRGLRAWRVLSAVALLAVGAIHLYLVATSTGGLMGVLFTLQGIGALVLAGAMLALRGRLFPLVTVLSLLFMAGSWLALVLALTVGLFGLRSSLSYDLAPTSLVVETLGTVVLAVTTAKVARSRRM